MSKTATEGSDLEQFRAELEDTLGEPVDEETAAEIKEEFDEQLIHDAIEAIEDLDVDPTVERVEAVLSDVDAEINAAAATAEKLSASGPTGGESA
jgi:hypothetical protein